MPKRILLVSNDPAQADAVRRALLHSRDGPFEVDWERTRADALARLDAATPPGAFAAVLADINLPDSMGIETFVRLFAAAAPVPILVLADAKDEATAELAVQRGAQDYLLKDRLDDYLLPKAVRSMIERAAIAEARFAEKERAEVTLDSIGDAVLSIDTAGAVTYLNAVAEQLTGWLCAEAFGRPVEEVFRLIDGATGEPAANPMARALREDRAAGLPPDCLLVRRDGGRAPIEDSAAPIHDRHGRLTGAVMVFHDVSAARAEALRMSHLAEHDGLTDLPNRLLLTARLHQALSMAQRQGRQLAVLYLDIDRFKHVNDTCGHAVGDRLLQSVAARLLACVRTSDTVSRQGGDEFVILLADVAHALDATVAAEKIIEAMAKPHAIDGLLLHVTASIGIVTYPQDGAAAEVLLKNADAALYQAKERGRNNYQFFKAEMNVDARERQKLEAGLRHALERREFVLHYQPRVDLRTGASTGVEALIRWRPSSRRLIRPARFLSIAEESGLIVPIGRWALGEACRQARAWQDAGLAPLPVSVNISPVELRVRGFAAGVAQILAETGLDARHLELEITDASLMQDAMSTGAVLHELAEMGVQLALDDFGTGYSSLSALKRFPIHVLKIDQSFVRDLLTESGDAGIVSAMVNIGRSLAIRVVAEGVETLEQCEYLKRQSCFEAQGFYFGEPAIPEEIAELLVGTAG